MARRRHAAAAFRQLCHLGVTAACRPALAQTYSIQSPGAMSRAKNRPRLTPRIAQAGAQPAAAADAGQPPIATLIEYGPDERDYRETRFTSLVQSETFEPLHKTLWLNVHGLHDPALLKAVGERFKLHPLTLEDLCNTDQRSKVEAFDHYLYIVAKIISYDAAQGAIITEQISIILGRGFVLTFQEKPTGTFNDLREGLRHCRGLVRRFGADYLVYSLLDKLVDRYFGVLETLGEQVEALEDEVTHPQPRNDTLKSIHALRREMLSLRRALWPIREVLNALQRDDADYFGDETQLYLRDVYDHTVHLIESLESLRDLIGSLIDLFMSAQGIRLNKEMRLLTVIATIFMPLTFVTSLYGMNFENMPELKVHNGYYYVLGLMAAMLLGMCWLFWRRRWL